MSHFSVMLSINFTSFDSFEVQKQLYHILWYNFILSQRNCVEIVTQWKGDDCK